MTSSDFVTIVSGMPRSGTSMMMQMLEAGGIPALTDQVAQRTRTISRATMNSSRSRRPNRTARG